MKYLVLFYLFFGLFFVVHAKNSETVEPEGFKLVDEVCLAVEGETQILRSHIDSRSREKSITFGEAMGELEQETYLWVYARKQLKYNLADIDRQTEDQIKSIRDPNNLSPEQFAEALMGPPYFKSYYQFTWDRKTDNLKNLIGSTRISLNEAEIYNDFAKKKLAKSNSFDVVFVTILPPEPLTKRSAEIKEKPITAQFKSANEIRAFITPQTQVNELEKRYGGRANVSIIGPINENSLKAFYQKRLKAMQSALVSEPFKDDGAVTMIWKVKSSSHEGNDEKALLEEVKKLHYDAAFKKEINAIADSMKADSVAFRKDCQKGRNRS